MKQVICFGDSNTWGLIPGTSERYEWGVRWTSLVQDQLKDNDIRIIEEGLCGRTTIFDDVYRENRNGLKTLPLILESHNPIDAVVIMLGTNDCKSHYKPNAYKIGKGLERCIDKLTEVVPADKILVVSPIHLGDEVWKDEYDPEFDENSVVVSKELANEYKRIASVKNTHFLAASDYANPSLIDQEHMDTYGHEKLAQVISESIINFI